MRFAFYKASAGGALDRLIAWWTASPYSHVELVFADGVSFSSSPRDGGTRYKRIDFAAGHWDLVDLPTLPDAESRIRAWCDAQVPRRYDWRGVLGFVFRCGFDRGRWFCSEICLQAAQLDGLMDELVPHRTSPGALAAAAQAQGARSPGVQQAAAY